MREWYSCEVVCKWVYALRSLGIILTLSVISVCSQNMGLCVCVWGGGGGEGGRGGGEREKWVLCVRREEVRSEEGEMNVWGGV